MLRTAFSAATQSGKRSLEKSKEFGPENPKKSNATVFRNAASCLALDMGIGIIIWNIGNISLALTGADDNIPFDS